MTGDRKERIPSRFLNEVLGISVNLFSALFANLMRGFSNEAAVSTQLLVTCHLSLLEATNANQNTQKQE